MHFVEFGSKSRFQSSMLCISAILAHRSVISPFNRAYRQILPTDRLSGGALCQADRRRDESCSLNHAYRQILPADRQGSGAQYQSNRQSGKTQAPTGALAFLICILWTGEELSAPLLIYADGSYPRMYSASTAARPSSYRNTGLMSSSAMSPARSQAKCEMSTSAFANASLSSGG